MAFVALAGLAFVATAAAEPACSCERVAALDAKIASLDAKLASQDGELATLRAQMQDLIAAKMADASSSSKVQVDATGAGTPSPESRRKLTSSSYVAISSKHVHEFPSGHSCGSLSGYMEYLPTKMSGQVSWENSPTDVTANMALVTVGSDWSTTSLDSFAAPLKLVHDSTCSAAPTLTLPLNTNVEGTLSVGGNAPLTHSAYRALKCRGTHSNVAGKCVKGVGDNWQMNDCNLDHDEVKLFWYGKMIEHAKTGTGSSKCFLAQDDGNVVTAGCNNGDGAGNSQNANAMYFYFDGENLKNLNDGSNKCMQCGASDGGSVHGNDAQVHMNTCDGSDYQKWYWWLPGDP